MVVASGLKAGDVLCRESELEDKLGVSRPILREAISRLRAVGLLDSRQSVGLIVGKPDPFALFEQGFEAVAMDALEMRELAELRYALEVGAAELVVERATPRQLTRLKQLADEFDAGGLKKNPDRTVDDIELDFHTTYLETGQNRMLTRMHSVITAFFRRAVREIAGWNKDWKEDATVWGHQAIVQALRERNVERTRAMVAGHLAGLLSIHRKSRAVSKSHNAKENTHDSADKETHIR